MYNHAYLLIVLTWINSVSGSFLISCNHLVSNVAVDPIVSPGQQSGHDHTFVGSNAISQNTLSGEDLRTGDCYTCGGGDKSAYWIPTLMWKYPNGTLKTARFKNSMAAYWSNSLRGTGIPVDISFFPLGLKFIAGNASATSLSDAAPFYGWSCGDDLTKATKTWPVKQCTEYMRLSIDLPDCWDGLNMFLSGSKHMAYSDNVKGCPVGFKRMWSLRLEFDHYIEKDWFWDSLNPPKFVLGKSSMDSPYMIHADFFNGFTIEEQQTKMNICGNLGPDFCHQNTPTPSNCVPKYVSPFMVITPPTPSQTNFRWMNCTTPASVSTFTKMTTPNVNDCANLAKNNNKRYFAITNNMQCFIGNFGSFIPVVSKICDTTYNTLLFKTVI